MLLSGLKTKLKRDNAKRAQLGAVLVLAFGWPVVPLGAKLNGNQKTNEPSMPSSL